MALRKGLTSTDCTGRCGAAGRRVRADPSRGPVLWAQVKLLLFF
jgi:hypothetical protein